MPAAAVSGALGGPVCLNAQQWTSYEISFGSGLVLFFSLTLSLSVPRRRGEETDRACWELPPSPTPPNLPPTPHPHLTPAAAARNTKANIDMRGGETRPRGGAFEGFPDDQVTITQMFTQSLPRRPPPSPHRPCRGTPFVPDCSVFFLVQRD